jgi:hypothetical protein
MYAMYPQTSGTFCDARCNKSFGALQKYREPQVQANFLTQT